MGKLTALDIQRFYKKLLTEGQVERKESENQLKGLSAKTVRNIHQILSSAMELAKQQKLIASSPTEGCTLPKVSRRN